jgi:hypothetical protein
MFLVLKMQPFKLEGEQMSWAGLYGGRWEIKEFIEMDESDQYWLGAGGRGKNDLDAVNNLFENLKKMR